MFSVSAKVIWTQQNFKGKNLNMTNVDNKNHEKKFSKLLNET